MPSSPLTPILATARSLAIDHMTAEVVSAFEREGIPSVVLKGPAIATWLYRDGAARSYGDSDILVPPRDGDRAGIVLAMLGFERVPAEEVPYGPPWVERKYVRRTDRGVVGVVDLHRGIESVDVARFASWDVLTQRTEKMRLAGREVTILDEPARAFHVAIHAFQHGVRLSNPLEDLRRAAEQLPLAVWAAAAEVARSLDVVDRFAVGLRTVPEGAAVAERLELPTVVRAETALLGSGVPRFLKGLVWLRRLDGTKPKLVFVARALVPPPDYLRTVDPRARGGTARLLLGYGRRLATVARHAPAALRALVHTRRSKRERG